MPKKAIVMLSYILNACIKLSYFPDSWKKAKVIAIHKPGKDPFDPASYRPIGLLSSLSKILEKKILKQINHHLESEEVLPNVQFGFRADHSTNHQLFRVSSHIKENLSNRKSTGMVLFDIEKAFDRVWHSALLYKMMFLKFPVHVVKIVKSFLQNRMFMVDINGNKSSSKIVTAGVPQGAVMSPTLYNIFTYDLPKFVETDDCEISQFADDTAFYTSSECPNKIISTLEDSLQKLKRYCNKWNIKLNASKTQSIFFTRRRIEKYLPRRKLIMDNIEIEWLDSVKYLGLHLDKKLLFKTHIEASLEKAQRVFRLLYSLLNRKSKLSNQHKLLIYKCIVRPVFMYGSPVWSNCANSHIKKVQIYQNKNLKTIFNLPWRYPTDELHYKSETEHISQFIRRINEHFIISCQTSANPVINQLI